MFFVYRSFFSLLFSYGLLLLANGLFNSLLGLRATLEGVTPSWLGFIIASYFLGLLLGGLLAGRIVASAGQYALAVLGDASLIPQFTATLLISGLVLQWPLGRLLDRIGRGWLMMLVPICICVSALGVIWALLCTRIYLVCCGLN